MLRDISQGINADIDMSKYNPKEDLLNMLSNQIKEKFDKTISSGQVRAIIKRELNLTLTSTERSQLHELRKKIAKYQKFIETFGRFSLEADHSLKILFLGLSSAQKLPIEPYHLESKPKSSKN